MKIRHFSDGEKVAKKFKQLGEKFKIKVICDIKETIEPAGRGVGPALEGLDVLSVLEQHKDRPMKLEVKALRLAGKLLDICYEDSKEKKNGEEEAARLLKDGSALKKFKEIVKAQGGNSNISTENFQIHSSTHRVVAERSGTIKTVNNFNLNSVAKILGAPQDKYAGIYLMKKTDDRVTKDELLLKLYSTDSYRLKEAVATLENFPIYEIER